MTVVANGADGFRRTRAALLVLGLVLGLAAATLGIVTRLSDEPPFWPPYGLLIDLVVFGSFLGLGAFAWRRRPDSRVGQLMMAVAFAYVTVLLSWSTWDVAETIVLVLSNLPYAVVAHLFVAYPTGRVNGRVDRLAVALPYALVAVILVISLGSPTTVPGCALSCPNLLFFPGVPNLDSLLPPVRVVALLTGLLALAVVLRHWREGAPTARRSMTPLLWAASAVLVALGVTWLLENTVGAALELYAFALPLALAMMPVAFAIGVLRTQLARGAVGDLLMAFDKVVSPPELQASIARALGDPTLAVLFWRDDLQSFIDVEARPTAVPASDPDRATTFVGRQEQPIAALVHDPSLLEDPHLVRSVAAAARLALENARLEDEVRLSHEVAPGLAERLRRAGRRIGDTERLVITVLMSDIRGYTTMAEDRDQVTLAAQLQEHRTAMAAQIAARGGTVMQYVGDAVFAVFGAPEPLPDHGPRALAAAQGMQAAQEALDQVWVGRGLPPFHIGIGLTTGAVAAALLGSEDHLEYSVIGDVVNLCARIQQWADGDIVLDEATYHTLDDAPDAERLEPTAVKGRTSLVVAYRVNANA